MVERTNYGWRPEVSMPIESLKLPDPLEFAQNLPNGDAHFTKREQELYAYFSCGITNSLILSRLIWGNEQSAGSVKFYTKRLREKGFDFKARIPRERDLVIFYTFGGVRSYHELAQLLETSEDVVRKHLQHLREVNIQVPVVRRPPGPRGTVTQGDLIIFHTFDGAKTYEELAELLGTSVDVISRQFYRLRSERGIQVPHRRTPNQGDLIIFHTFDGAKTYEELAGLLGISVKSVMNLFYILRGRRNIQVPFVRKGRETAP